MRSFTIQENISSPVLSSFDLEQKDKGIVVKVLASALNHRDIWITKGMYPGIRYGAVMGSDACVDHEGQDYIVYPGLNWGNNQSHQSSEYQVLGVPTNGTFADNMLTKIEYLRPKPEHLNVLQAAALPLAGLTAYRALMVRGALQAGEKVLISGIGGGVALMTMQIALANGCQVYVTSGDDNKISKALELGASGGYNYKDENWAKTLTKDIDGIDVTVDGAGGDGLSNFEKIALPGGRIVFYGGTMGTMNGISPQVIFWKQLSIMGSTMGSNVDFDSLLSFVSQHKVTPVLDSVLSFEEIPLGFERMASGKQFGKIVFDHAK